MKLWPFERSRIRFALNDDAVRAMMGILFIRSGHYQVCFTVYIFSQALS